MTPERIQLSRRKGWRKPENTVVVARPSKWGNPFRIESGHRSIVRGPGVFSAHDHIEDARRMAVDLFRQSLAPAKTRCYWDGMIFRCYPLDDEIRAELAGKNLACWCPLDQPCHADVLLEIANQEDAP